jgi:hypothetical protein
MKAIAGGCRGGGFRILLCSRRLRPISVDFYHVPAERLFDCRKPNDAASPRQFIAAGDIGAR